MRILHDWISARSTASSRNLLGILLQCRRQELKVSGAKRKANARGSYSKFALSIIDFSSSSYL